MDVFKASVVDCGSSWAVSPINFCIWELLCPIEKFALAKHIFFRVSIEMIRRVETELTMYYYSENQSKDAAMVIHNSFHKQYNSKFDFSLQKGKNCFTYYLSCSPDMVREYYLLQTVLVHSAQFWIPKLRFLPRKSTNFQMRERSGKKCSVVVSVTHRYWRVKKFSFSWTLPRNIFQLYFYYVQMKIPFQQSNFILIRGWSPYLTSM